MKSEIRKIKNIYHLIQAFIANVVYGFPSQKLKMIGVTGTDGKTTTTHLIYHILTTAGKKASMISSVYGKVGGQEYNTGFHVTTPNPFFIQKMLRQAVDKGDNYFVLETTSHALDQNRIWGIVYEVGVLTNVTHEHLDYHQNYNDYLKAKLRLFERSKIAVVNKDDESYKKLKTLLRQAQNNQILKIFTYGYKNGADFKKQFNLNLTEYNKYNYLAAYSVGQILSIPEQTILNAMENFKLPSGRLDIVYDKKHKVIVDFAHTPNAFLQVLPSVRSMYLKDDGRLIHVFGSAGLRDFTKRPLMGEASGKYADLVILTEEDYRTEDPMEICLAIAKGLEKQGFKREHLDVSKQPSKIFDIIIDREKAIKKALEIAQKNDVIILTGKGHEKSLCRGKKEYPWDEKEMVLKFNIIL